MQDEGPEEAVQSRVLPWRNKEAPPNESLKKRSGDDGDDDDELPPPPAI